MKKYRICSIVMCAFVVIVLTCDIYNYVHAIFPAFNAYPILPFNARPSYVRGANRMCYSMDRILDMPEYCDIPEIINTWVEHSPKLDSLCIYSVTQYAWKKDSLLMEVSLKDNTMRWLLASPPSLSEYRCKLQEVAISDIKNLSSYHKVSLANNYRGNLFDAIGLDLETQLYIEYALAIGYLLMILAIPVLNVVCLILLIKYRNEIDAVLYKRILDVCALIFPIVVLIGVRIITFMVFIS